MNGDGSYDMRLLRDVREATKLLILKELTARRHSRLRTIAERLDITVQGVSEYMKIMTKEGLVRNVDGEWRITAKGVEFLQADFLALKEFVESSVKEMSIVDVAVAIAGADIKEREKLGLFMENGELVAYPSKTSTSKGVAVNSATKGEYLAVRGLEGIVRLRPGKVTILRVPSAKESGRKQIDIAKAGRIAKRHSTGAVAVVDLVGRILARKMDLDVDIAFSVLPGTLEAAQRGLDVLVLCPEDRVTEFISGIEEANSRIEDKIAYETVSIN